MDPTRRILQTARTIGPEEAMSLGFLDEVAEEGRWPATIAKAADTSVALPPRARGLTRIAAYLGNRQEAVGFTSPRDMT